jgi:glycosyltransferase involved in cell wall biosynthesis
LYAGKFEDKKRPVALMQAVQQIEDSRLLLVMVGDGVLGDQVRQIAAEIPARFRVLPFQNQSRMPVVYRLGDIFVLPSAYGETWGLAVNEALACGRPVLVSDHVGCAADLVKPKVNGGIFRADDWDHFRSELTNLMKENWRTRRESLRNNARGFSTEHGMTALVSVLQQLTLAP